MAAHVLKGLENGLTVQMANLSKKGPCNFRVSQVGLVLLFSLVEGQELV